MKPPPMPPPIPNHWTPAQALAVFELIDLLRDQIWLAYGPAIQHAIRDDRQPNHQSHDDTDTSF
jgi:hypothetical protein